MVRHSRSLPRPRRVRPAQRRRQQRAPAWLTDITPPDTGQVVQYAASPDVPRLLLATIGGYSRVSADPPPVAQLWRSTDGGASWRSVDSLSILAGAEVAMPPGGHGLAFVYDPLGQGPAISVSADAGASWRSLPTNSTNDDTVAQEWTWLSSAVAIGSRLYTGGVAPGWGGLQSGAKGFSVSNDSGFTWRSIEMSADPAGEGMITQAITPLDATGSAWLRLSAQGSILSPMGSGLPSRLAIERSNDGGMSWRVLAQTPRVAGELWSARLSTDPVQPGKVCVAVTTNTLSSSGGGALKGRATLAVVGPPAPTPLDVSLFVSGDSGASWSGGVVARLHGVYGGPVPPGVRIGADGSCYLAIAQVGNVIGAPTDIKGALWRLDPGVSTATPVFTMTDRELRMLTLAPGASGESQRLIALTRNSGPGDGQSISCGQNCQTYRDGGIYRLIWEPLPSA